MDAQDPQTDPAQMPLAGPESVLADLGRAEMHYRAVLADAQRQAEALRASQAQVGDLVGQLAAAQEANAQLVRHVQGSREQAVTAQQEVKEQQALVVAHAADAQAQQQRRRQLEDILQSIHKTFFGGDVYALILKACLTITGASRGVYVTLRSADAPPKIRAAFDVDHYPAAPPSPFLQALCARVMQDDQTFIAHTPEDLAGLPPPSADTERFHNCIAAPVSLLANLNGIVICADKTDDDFDDEDVRSVLAVGNQAVIAAENAQLRREIQEAYLATVAVMADAMEAKDSYTRGHSEQVSRYARLIARHLNLTDLERSVVSYAALLHDIGKIGVSDGLLNKPGPLLPEERELVRTHVRVGHDLLHHVPALRPVAHAVLHHHECYDGTGYPHGLTGDAIPVAARIVCVVDAYSAMVTRRSYKDAYSEERAREELRRCAGSQFDPRIVDAFLYVMDLPDLPKSDDDEDESLEWLPAFTLARQQAQAG